MRALVVDPSAEHGMELSEVAEPDAGSDGVLIEVAFAGVNAGDLNDARSGRLQPGEVLGSDVAGTVVRDATSTLSPGTPVVALAPGAFADRVVAASGSYAVLPPEVDLAQAATLPVAGVAALRALRSAGPLDGRRVLVTGASGGVGRFAVQLAAQAGADVTAAVGSLDRAGGLRDAGADVVVDSLDAVHEPVDHVVETVGGPVLVAAWQLLAPGGHLESVGWASGQPAVLPPYATIGPPKALRSFLNLPPFGDDLATLVAWLADGSLAVDVGGEFHVTRFADAVEALRSRRLRGKAVLRFDGAP